MQQDDHPEWNFWSSGLFRCLEQSFHCKSNARRLDSYYQIDLRVDKYFYFPKWAIGFYVDIQNVTLNKIDQPDAWLSTGVITDPDVLPSEQRYKLEMLELTSGTIVPAIGVTVEF